MRRNYGGVGYIGAPAVGRRNVCASEEARGCDGDDGFPVEIQAGEMRCASFLGGFFRHWHGDSTPAVRWGCTVNKACGVVHGSDKLSSQCGNRGDGLEEGGPTFFAGSGVGGVISTRPTQRDSGWRG